MIAKIENVKLLMWEQTLMKESVATKGTDGKTIFTKTDKDLEYTTYVFRDFVGEKIVLTSKNNSYRTLEGEDVTINLSIKYDDFNRKNKISLTSIEKTGKPAKA